MNQKTSIVLFGAPGSGKGFLGECVKEQMIDKQIVAKEQIGYISTGDLLRAEVASNSLLGQQISQTIASGKLVSDEIVNTLVEKALNGPEKVIFIDGYPRTLSQFEAFLSIVKKTGVNIFSIKRDTPTDLILQRVLKRRICEKCKSTHSVDDGKCPKCGGKSIVRKDDAVINNRLLEYEQNTAPLWEQLIAISQKSLCIDGSIEATDASEMVIKLFY